MDKVMKDSGVEWIGEIPQEWEVTRLGKYFVERSTKVSDYDYEPLSVTKQGIVKQLQTAAKTDAHDARKLVCKGDFVINSRSDRKQSCGLSDYDGSVSLINIVLINKFYNQNYVRYLLKNYGFAEEYYRWGTGIVADLWSTNFTRMKKILLPVPPLPIQQHIADYLDEKCKEIDSIIDNTKNTIEEYKNYKYAVIADAVTKGLSASVKFKNSSVDWIGNVPVDWGIIKIKYLFSIKKEIANKLGYDILSVTQGGLRIKDISSNEGQISSDYSKYQIVEPNNFVMNHMDLLTGWVDCSVFYGVTSPDYRVFKLDAEDKALREYFKYIFQLCYKHRIFYGLGQGVSNMGRWRLQTDKFINFEVPLPSIKEQKEIVEFLDVKCSEIDNLISKKQQIVNELEDYKKSLIYECVTGKVEV